MRKFTLFILVSTCLCLPVSATNFKADKEIVLSTAEFGDYYLAADDITTQAVIDGDLIAAAGTVVVEDTVLGDVMIGAGRVTIRGYVNDDARISGGEVVIDNIIAGDLIVFAGKVKLTERGKVLGDVICYGGSLSIYGDVKGTLCAKGGEIRIKSTIHGNAEMKAGKIDLDGHILGNAVMSAETITIGKGAYCEGTLTYWSGDGEMDLSKVTSKAVWDEDLAMVDKNVDWSVLGLLLGVGFIAYALIFIVSAFVILLLFEKLFQNIFHSAALAMKNSYMKSFGYGMIYFLGMPIVILLLFVIIIGIPIAAAGAAIYFASFLFSSTISGLCVAHYLKNRSNKQWTYMQTVGYALLTVIILKIIFVLPILGALVKLVVVGGAYGALLLVLLERRKSRA